ncbi:MAG: hypothetical protein HQK50_12120 [Oligoflexia bacterium]|nr:hypothetical protein [Oligoflexia bacterium]MBF0366311.1 hypothetical protein [Oligoflexia bacterium]
MKNFLYFLTVKECESHLKQEIALRYPELRYAYSRAGFLTYKIAADHEIDNLEVIFAYSYGKSLGKSSKMNFFSTLESILKEEKGEVLLNTYVDIDFHLNLCEYLKAHPKIISEGNKASAQSVVLNIIKVDEDEYFFGSHLYGKNRTIINDYAYAAVAEGENTTIPSRAYHKIREALLLTKEEIKSGDYILDVGSAPGGISYYFLERDAFVVGIDSAEMSKQCLMHKRFKHIALPIEKVRAPEFGNHPFKIMVVDINLDPLFVLHEIRRLFTSVKSCSEIRSLYFTVKLTQKFSMDKLPRIIKELESLGFVRFLKKQLQSNRNEFLLYATKGQRKIVSKRTWSIKG